MQRSVALCLASWIALGLSAQDTFDSLSRKAAAALQSNPADAAKLYQQAVALRPEWAEGWFYLGASLYQTRDYVESKEAFQRATQLASDNGSVWAFLGLCEYQMGTYTQSLRDIQKGEALGLGDKKQFISSIRNHAALICIRQGQFAAAMNQLQPLIVMADDSPLTIQTIGRSVLGWKDAVPDLPTEKKPLAEAAGRAWWAFWAERKDTGARFEELVKTYPDQPGVHYLYGLYLEQNQPAEALREFQREIEIRPSHVPSRLQAAALEMKAGASEAAVKVALEATRLEPSNPYTYVALGRAYMSAGELAKASAALQTAVKLAPQDRKTHLYLSQVYGKQGRAVDAEREQEEYKRLQSVQEPLVF
jgi:tetratricopeptide (TPR) repeat protein